MQLANGGPELGAVGSLCGRARRHLRKRTNMRTANAVLLVGLVLTLTIVCTNRGVTAPKPQASKSRANSLVQFLQQQQTVRIVKSLKQGGFSETYELRVTQPLDHADAGRGTFEQRVHLMHRDVRAPTLVWISGYRTHFPPETMAQEMSAILSSNVVLVEYRFYGKSLPQDGKVPYEFLDNTQGATDHHQIIHTFKKYYKNKWVSSGYSKGGQSALIHRSIFPDDVDVVVPYNSPIIHGREDPRTAAFLYSNGSKECRTRLFDFQRMALEHRQAMIEKLKAYAPKNNLTFTRLGLGGAIEYAVLEHTFSFWQWGHQIEDVPQRGATVDELFEHLIDTSGVRYYSDQGIHDLRQSYYQHMRELGYYGFPTERLSDLLVDAKDASNLNLAPKGVDLTYNPGFMWKVHKWLDQNGNNIIYIYGENDTWAAAGVTPTTNTNAIRVDQIQGYHNSRVESLSDEQKKTVYDTLEEWLQIKVKRL